MQRDGWSVGVYSFFFQAEDGIRDIGVTGVQTCALPIWRPVKGGELADWTQGEPRLVVVRCDRCGLRWYLRREHCPRCGSRERKSGGEGKSVDLGGRRILKKKQVHTYQPYVPCRLMHSYS